jgi:peptidoglycan/LPS O-acetylase OafA/YrhL
MQPNIVFKPEVTFPQKNNFDLLRLLAALQILIFHGYEHFKLEGQNLFIDFIVQRLIIYFPGVPIFFAISGFLIFSSFNMRKDLKVYFKNRFLRLFPGLWVSFLITFIILFYFKFLTFRNLFTLEIMSWVVGQISFFQFFTPIGLKGYGLGNPNGSLWTIVVEIQYYVLVPIIHILFKLNRLRHNIFLGFLIFVSLLSNMFLSDFVGSSNIVGKIIGVTILPYLFYFLLGAIAYLNYSRLSRFIENRVFLSSIFYFLYYIFGSIIAKQYYPGYFVNIFGFINSLFLTWFVFALAFSKRDVSHRILKEYDLSYGLYLYHGIVLNFLIHLNYPSNFSTMIIYLLLSIALAFFSWKWVEYPALKFKKRRIDTAYRKP